MRFRSASASINKVPPLVAYANINNSCNLRHGQPSILFVVERSTTSGRSRRAEVCCFTSAFCPAMDVSLGVSSDFGTTMGDLIAAQTRWMTRNMPLPNRFMLVPLTAAGQLGACMRAHTGCSIFSIIMCHVALSNECASHLSAKHPQSSSQSELKSQSAAVRAHTSITCILVGNRCNLS